MVGITVAQLQLNKLRGLLGEAGDRISLNLLQMDGVKPKAERHEDCMRGNGNVFFMILFIIVGRVVIGQRVT